LVVRWCFRPLGLGQLLGLNDIGGGDADEPQAVGARLLVAAVNLVTASNDPPASEFVNQDLV